MSHLATPVDPPTARPSFDKFVLFDVIPHEQLNKQRRALMFFLQLAITSERTLVLPRARLLRRVGGSFAKEAEYVRWSELFNISLLQRRHSVMDLETFLDEHGQVETLVPISGCEPTAEATVVQFNGLPVRMERTECKSGHRVGSRLMSEPSRSIAFLGTSDQAAPSTVAPLRPYVRYEQSIYDTARDFVQRTFGTEPFVAIHWRRTDFLRVRTTQPGVLQSADDVVTHARQLMARHGIKKVYLATDSDDAAELAVVTAQLQPARFERAWAAEGLQAKAALANVEIAICGMASFFLGTKTSSYTLAIVEERQAVFGFAADTASNMDTPPVRATDKQEL